MKYSALPDRAPLKWPNDARIAVVFTINIEQWDMTHDSDVPLYAGGRRRYLTSCRGRCPDYANFSWREYGQRIGIWRLIEVFDKAGVPTTCTINARTALDRRRIVDAVNERGWEILAHNYVQTEMLNEFQVTQPPSATSSNERSMFTPRRSAPVQGVAFVVDALDPRDAPYLEGSLGSISSPATSTMTSLTR